jgi:N-acetylneuraminic acid mutarotase
MSKDKKIKSLSDFYTIDMADEKLQWKKFFMMDAPSPRDSHSMVKIGDLIILFGGRVSPEGRALNELWTVDCRYAQWGGKSVDISGCVWEQMEVVEGPGELRSHSACVAGTSMIVFGGTNFENESNNLVWLYTPMSNTWQLAQTEGQHPCPRHSHSASTIKSGTYMIMFGGVKQDGEALNDLYILDVASMHWIRPIIGGAIPSPRFQCSTYAHSFFNEKTFSG